MKKVIHLRKVLSLIVLLFGLLFVTACVESNSADSNSTNAKGTVSSEEVDKMYSDPKGYKGYEVEFTGQVFVEPERDQNGIYLQIYAKPENDEQNMIVVFEEDNFEVNTDDYVKVIGIVKDEFKGENLMGGTITAPLIKASSIEVVDYITAVSPTIKTIEVGETIGQHGIEVQVQKVEFAKNQTRVYVKVMNHTDDTAYVDTYSTKLVTGTTQFESTDNFESGLPEIPYEILAGIESEGVITFPIIDEQTESFTLHVEAHSDNYELDFNAFIFEINEG